MRPVALCVAGVVISAGTLVLTGWHTTNIVLSAMLVVITGIMVFRLWSSMGRMAQMFKTAQATVVECEDHYVSVLRRIMKFVEAREKLGGGHSGRVGSLAAKMAAGMGMSQGQCTLMGPALSEGVPVQQVVA